MLNKRGVFGASLLELLVSLLLVSLTFIGAVSLHIEVERRTSLSLKRLQALELIETRLELLRGRGLGAASEAQYHNLTSHREQNEHEIELEWQVSEHFSGAVKIVTIHAHWQDSFGNPQTFALVTAIARDSEHSQKW
ncbi:hypothetical protein [Vibrio sp. WXL210]|uniref:hypothetical protein n=1 Tax=Vibrio sp. WXL210 TaxID=3450709 RepID=UPI003EC55F24